MTEYRYFENEGAFYRSKVEAGFVAWIDVWTPTGWQNYTGDRAARYATATPITEAQVPKFRESRLGALPRDIQERHRRDFALALELAYRLHDAATFAHVKRVVDRVRAGADPRAMIVAALHDAVEDTPITVAVIENVFGRDIGDAVAAITRLKTENYLTDYIPRVAAAGELARIVKRADLEDHLALVETLTPEKKERYERAREVLLAPRPVSGRAFQILAASPKPKPR